MPRKKLIAANWKMYKTPDQTSAFMQEFLPLVAGHTRDEIVMCPPFVDIAAVVAAAKGTNDRSRRAEHALGKGRRIHRRDFRGEMLHGVGCK